MHDSKTSCAAPRRRSGLNEWVVLSAGDRSVWWPSLRILTILRSAKRLDREGRTQPDMVTLSPHATKKGNPPARPKIVLTTQ